MEELKEVLGYISGRTSLLEHQITMGNARMTKLQPCRFPLAQRRALKQEFEMTKQNSIIEESDSERAQHVTIRKTN